MAGGKYKLLCRGVPAVSHGLFCSSGFKLVSWWSSTHVRLVSRLFLGVPLLMDDLFSNRDNDVGCIRMMSS